MLKVEMLLEREAVTKLQERIADHQAQRREKQPNRPSAGSVFANPPGDHAGRLIEAAGLKGTSVGDAQVSPKHANFFVNMGKASALDVLRLIEMVRERVYRLFKVHLELEIQLVGDWPPDLAG